MNLSIPYRLKHEHPGERAGVTVWEVFHGEDNVGTLYRFESVYGDVRWTTYARWGRQASKTNCHRRIEALAALYLLNQ